MGQYEPGDLRVAALREAVVQDLLVVFNLYRVLGGIGVGMASALCPMYIGEISPSNIRGMLVSFNQFAIIFGQLVVYFVNFLILGDHTNPVIESIGQGFSAVMPNSDPWTIATGWRYMFGSECILAGLFTILICFVLESPVTLLCPPGQQGPVCPFAYQRFL